jgi:hypothetical protein
VTSLEILRDALSRIIRIREGHADGDLALAEQIAEDLEHDLAGAIVRLEEAA